jgi:hypothetical protein
VSAAISPPSHLSFQFHTEKEFPQPPSHAPYPSPSAATRLVFLLSSDSLLHPNSARSQLSPPRSPQSAEPAAAATPARHRDADRFLPLPVRNQPTNPPTWIAARVGFAPRILHVAAPASNRDPYLSVADSFASGLIQPLTFRVVQLGRSPSPGIYSGFGRISSAGAGGDCLRKFRWFSCLPVVRGTS